MNRMLASGLLVVGVSSAQAQVPVVSAAEEAIPATKELTPGEIALKLLGGTLQQGMQGGNFSGSQQTDVKAAMGLLNGTMHATPGQGGTFSLSPVAQGTDGVASADDGETMTRAERRAQRRAERQARREAWQARHQEVSGTSATTSTSSTTGPVATTAPAAGNVTSETVAGNTAGGMTDEETEKLQAALNGKPAGSAATAPAGELTPVQSAAVVEKNPLLKAAKEQGVAVTPDMVAQAAAADPTLTEGAPGATPVAAAPAATTQASATPPAAPQVSGFNAVWSEDFCSGFGLLSRYWGPGIDTSVPCQITLSSTPDNVDSGVMVPPTGANSGNGYGLYSFTLKMEGDAPGPYALLWPATDVWPGPELDIIERQKGGQGYSTIHKKASDGSNAYSPYMINGIDLNQTHTYSMAWLPGQLIGYVDGVQVWTTTADVPADAAHGGENSAPGFGMQTWWSADQQSGPNRITVFRVSYSTPNFAGDTVAAN